MTSAVSIFVHQFDLARIPSLAALAQTWPSWVYAKAYDGVNPMDAFDTSPLAVRSIAGGSDWSWRSGNGLTPWVVPAGHPSTDRAEGQIAAQLANASGDVVLDLEPYPQFWVGGEADAEAYLAAYSEVTAIKPALTIDPRRLADGFPYASFLGAASRLLPQTYWTDFQQLWQTVLEEAREACSRLTPAFVGRKVEYVLPGNATDADFELALNWCMDQDLDIAVWLWQTISAAKWDMLRSVAAVAANPASPDDPAPVPTPCGDLVNALGYIQGDLAHKLESSNPHPTREFKAAIAELRAVGQ